MLLAACGPSEPAYPQRSCEVTFWARSERPGASLEVTGSWDGWTTAAPFPEAAAGDWRALTAELPAGEHGYLVVEDGVARLDPRVPLSTYRGEDEVSYLEVPDCHAPELRMGSVEETGPGAALIRASFVAGRGGAPLDPWSIVAVTREGDALSVIAASPATGEVAIAGEGLARGRHDVVVEAADATGRRASARAAAWVDPAAISWREGLVYQVVIDRFRGDGGASLAPPATPTTRAGGTLGGVLAELETGYFEALGVTALWLSPVYVNPLEARDGRDGHPSEGYHGYWPLASREVEPRIGGRDALEALIRAAHARGIRVLLDLVPNHVYEGNPRYAEHRGDGWYNDGPSRCVCGTEGCAWADRIESCWFAPYLPDVRWQHEGAMREAEDDAVFWATELGVDGFRVDAVPMMPRAATRRIARAVRTRAGRRDDTFLLGEVFTGGGQGGAQEIRYHLGPDGLDSAFDFPLMWAARDAFARGSAGFDELEEIRAITEDEHRGSGAVEARFLGNHDTTRFLSEAAGDAAQDPWSAPPTQPTASAPFRRHRMALAFLYTETDLPVVYYGDEVGLAGGADPDCRRVMPAEGALSAEQASVLAVARRLGALRACSAALRRGGRAPLVVERDVYAYARDAGDGDPVIALFSRASTDAAIALPRGAVPPGAYVDALTGDVFDLTSDAPSVPMPALSARVLLPATSPCL
jgi:glycosidase